jgi:hypothetical protein
MSSARAPTSTTDDEVMEFFTNEVHLKQLIRQRAEENADDDELAIFTIGMSPMDLGHLCVKYKRMYGHIPTTGILGEFLRSTRLN